MCLTGRFVLGLWRFVLRLEDGSELLPQGSVGVGGEDGGLGAGRHCKCLSVWCGGGGGLGGYLLARGGRKDETQNVWGFYIRTAQPKPNVLGAVPRALCALAGFTHLPLAVQR